MKVGIITYHRAENFGAFLQCYALFKKMEQLGLDVEVVDYRQSYIERTYKIFRPDIFYGLSILGKIKYLKNLIKNLPIRLKRKKIYRDIRGKYLKISKPFYDSQLMCNSYDIIIIGSDQLWNTNYTQIYDNIYWGTFNKRQTKLIGYSISGNTNSIISADSSFIEKAIQNFDAISLRESILTAIVKEKTKIEIFTTVDPTFLHPASYWENLIKNQDRLIDNPYILCYGVRPYKGNLHILSDMAESVKTNNLIIYDLNEQSRYYRYTPIQFLSLIYNASYIITSSFHGLAFSIIFHKKFYSIRYNDGDDDRALNLLKELGLEKHAHFVDECLRINQKWNFVKADQVLEARRKQSIAYIKENL